MRSKSKATTTVASRRYAKVLREMKREIKRREEAQTALARSERHHRELLEKSRQMQEHLRRLSHEILTAQEEERKKISRDLHDQVSQTLTAINVKLTTLNKVATVNASSLKRQLAGTQRLLERSMTVVHRFARELRPPLLDDLGLTAALRSYMTEFTKRTRIPVHVTTFAAVDTLDSDKRTVIYRVAQEALTNVDRHARASLVRVHIKKLRGVVRMDIHDNGKSFPADLALNPTKIKRLGLLGMRERVEMVGGSFSIESARGEGTTVRADVPLGRSRRRVSAARIERAV
jgi:signal transduction histidine kinase